MTFQIYFFKNKIESWISLNRFSESIDTLYQWVAYRSLFLTAAELIRHCYLYQFVLNTDHCSLVPVERSFCRQVPTAVLTATFKSSAIKYIWTVKKLHRNWFKRFSARFWLENFRNRKWSSCIKSTLDSPPTNALNACFHDIFMTLQKI